MAPLEPTPNRAPRRRSLAISRLHTLFEVDPLLCDTSPELTHATATTPDTRRIPRTPGSPSSSNSPARRDWQQYQASLGSSQAINGIYPFPPPAPVIGNGTATTSRSDSWLLNTRQRAQQYWARHAAERRAVLARQAEALARAERERTTDRWVQWIMDLRRHHGDDVAADIVCSRAHEVLPGLGIPYPPLRYQRPLPVNVPVTEGYWNGQYFRLATWEETQQPGWSYHCADCEVAARSIGYAYAMFPPAAMSGGNEEARSVAADSETTLVEEESSNELDDHGFFRAEETRVIWDASWSTEDGADEATADEGSEGGSEQEAEEDMFHESDDSSLDEEEEESEEDGEDEEVEAAAGVEEAGDTEDDEDSDHSEDDEDSEDGEDSEDSEDDEDDDDDEGSDNDDDPSESTGDNTAEDIEDIRTEVEGEEEGYDAEDEQLTATYYEWDEEGHVRPVPTVIQLALDRGTSQTGRLFTWSELEEGFESD